VASRRTERLNITTAASDQGRRFFLRPMPGLRQGGPQR
jgi:hypothetical protein